MDAIEPYADVRGYFLEHIVDAMRSLRVEALDPTRQYLVDLLSGFSLSDRIPALTRPLAYLFRDAMEAAGPERVARMRDLGDIALFICGFFPDSFERRGIDQGYVVAMGGRAYWVVRESGRVHSPHGPEVFAELASRFLELARVIDEVRERTALCTDAAIVALYERWQATGSPEVARRLHRRGLTPSRPRGRGSAN